MDRKKVPSHISENCEREAKESTKPARENKAGGQKIEVGRLKAEIVPVAIVLCMRLLDKE